MKDVRSVDHYKEQLRNHSNKTPLGRQYLESYLIGMIQSLAEDGNNKDILNAIKAYDEVIKDSISRR